MPSSFSAFRKDRFNSADVKEIDQLTETVAYPRVPKSAQKSDRGDSDTDAIRDVPAFEHSSNARMSSF
jgi:hypothetical protein